MSRIDANLATQVADVSRPLQGGRDAQLQVQQAQALTSSNPESSQGKPMSADDMRAVAQQLKQVIESASGRKIAFGIDERSKLLYLQLRDAASNEIIREIPSEEVRELRAKLDEMFGLLFDKEA